MCALVVLLSLVFHGGVSAFLGRRLSPTTGSVTALPGADRPAAALPAVSVADRLLIHFEELDGLIKAGAPVRILDVRANPGWEASEVKAAGAIRLPPDRPVESAAALALPKHDWLVAYCA